MVEFSFIKMHGAGNDFVIIDARDRAVSLSEEQIRRISDRHLGVGCDQVIVVKSSIDSHVNMLIYNADGSEAGACGNATRCVARLFMDEQGVDSVTIETVAGELLASRADAGLISVDMGVPKLDWQDIPLASEQETLHLDIAYEGYSDPVAVNVGNPHMVFFVEDTASVDLADVGKHLECHALFPDRANVGFLQVLARDEVRLRVWERGAGETLACGSGACAGVIAGIRRGLLDANVTVHLPGGDLFIDWREGEGVVMTGGAEIAFSGVVKG